MSEPGYDDETLMAYADGELDAAAARSVEQAVAADAALADRVEMFRRTAAQAREAYAADLARPVPDALLAAVQAAIERAGPAPQPAAVPPNLQSPQVPRRPWWRAAANQPVFALAASVAVVTAGFLGYFLGGLRDAGPPGGLGLAATASETAAVVAALRELPSGERRALSQAAEVEMLATVSTSGGALCREFKLIRVQQSETTALACSTGGGWTVAFEATAATSGADYLPAGSQAAVDAYLGSIGASPPLSAEEERAALAVTR